MRKVVAGLFVSLDGVVEAPETWHLPYLNDEVEATIGAQIAASDTMLLGRVTYEQHAAYWADKPSGEPFADVMNNTPKLVASRTLDRVDWQNSSLIDGDVGEALTRLKAQPGKEIAINGSATLVRSLLEDDVLDELRLLVHPVVVGSGKRLFEDGPAGKGLTLLESRTFSTGVVSQTYAPVR